MKRTLTLVLVCILWAWAGAVPTDRGLAGCCANLKSIATALEMFACDHAGRYPAALNQLIPKYLQSLPICPTAAKETYSPSWRLAGSEGFFYCCSGDHHRVSGLKPNQPFFDARNGLGPESVVVPADCSSNLKNLATILEMYSTDHNGHYPTTLQELVPTYVRKLPLCGGQRAYRYSVSTGPDHFTLCCMTPRHSLYDSQRGLKRE